MPPRVLCIGLANWDYVFTIDECLEEDHKYRSRMLTESGGGPAANAACLLARWGCPVALVGHAGNDALGLRVRAELETYGVDTTWFRLVEGEQTSVSCVIASTPNGSRTIVNQPPAASLAVEGSPLPGSEPRVILVDGHEPAISRHALDRFPSATSVLDGGSLRDSTAELASLVDYAVVSAAFAKSATGLPLDSSEAALRCVEELSKRFPSRLCITLGPLGLATTADDGTPLHLHAPPVDTIDSTAAGDLFHGAFVWAIDAGLSYLSALRVATGAAALSVTHSGGRASIPLRDAALAFARDCFPELRATNASTDP
ncbi:MAG: PfkB family carbohydrate kinase [Polyangiaceae bacterium]